MNRSDIIPDSDPSSPEDQLPSDIVERANEARSNLLPVKSKEKYEFTYEKFMKWQMENKINSFSETVLVAYFSYLSEQMKSSTLWSVYSMLRSMIHLKHAINIHDYADVIAFLKQKHEGYQPKKSRVLTAENIEKFISEAPDNEFLAMKVAMIFGVSGACRRQELCDITIGNIKDKDDMILVNIPVTKNDKPRSFIVNGEFYQIYKKYASLRPPKVNTRRFFLNYRKGQCTSQVIGINTFGCMPRVIATYLKLENPELYTGHTFRRTSATILANTGAGNRDLKNLGGWRSNAVVDGYIENSIGNKKRIGNRIMNAVIKKTKQSIDSCPPKANNEQELSAARYSPVPYDEPEPSTSRYSPIPSTSRCSPKPPYHRPRPSITKFQEKCNQQNIEGEERVDLNELIDRKDVIFNIKNCTTINIYIGEKRLDKT